MKLINKLLYLTPEEAGIKRETIIRDRQRTDTSFVVVMDKGQGMMLQYESLEPKYQVGILTRYKGDPQLWFEERQVELALCKDVKAIDYFTRYRFSNGKCLSQKSIETYCQAANVLNALIKDRSLLSHIIKYIEANHIELPTSEDRLSRRINRYKKEGYACLISKRHLNTNAFKPKDLALIRQLAGRPNNFNHSITTSDYNKLAATKGLPSLSYSSIFELSKKAEMQILAQRQGKNAWRNRFDIVVGRKRPQYPLLLTVHDGFDWELYYQKQVTDKNGHRVTRHHFRKNVLVVVDAFNDYPLGYAIGEGENAALITQALRNAALHVAELTGGYHFPHQLKCDHFALAGLSDLYNKIATHVTPAQVGNARDKTIESWFKRFNDAYTCRHLNYAGKNADALKRNQPNRDFLDKYKKEFPDEAGVVFQIINDIEAERTAKRQAWLEAWNKCPQHLKRPVDRFQYLQTFGVQRERTKTLTNEGIKIIHRGETYKYLMLQHDFIESIGSQITITFDEATPQSVIATDIKNRRSWLVERYQPIPMALMDMQEGDRLRLNQLLQFKNEVEQRQIAANADDMTHLEAEGLLKGYFTYNGTNKQLLARAKRLMPSLGVVRPDVLAGGELNRSGTHKALTPASNCDACDEAEEQLELAQIFQAAYTRRGTLKPVEQ